jgi:hypothetical protein
MRFTTDPYAELAGIPVHELPSRTYAAAKLAMQSSEYSHDDRLDCSAAIIGRLMADAQDHMNRVPAKHGAARDVLAYMRRAELRAPSYGETIPSSLASFSRMSGMAANFRRSLDRRRAAEDRAMAASAASADFTPRMAEDATTDLATQRPEAAHAAAREALAALGLPRLGRAYPLAYAAVRAIPERTALAELGIGSHAASDGATRVAVSSALSRARKAVPSAQRWDMAEHLRAVGLLDTEGCAMKPTRSRNTSANLDTRERTSQRHMDAALEQRHTAPDPRSEPADWTRDLAPATDARLARAVELRRMRADARKLAEREALDAERGHSYPVR